MVVIQKITYILQSPSICYWNSLYVAAISFQECKNIKTMDMSWSKINIQQGIGGDPFLFQAFMLLLERERLLQMVCLEPQTDYRTSPLP